MRWIESLSNGCGIPQSQSHNLLLPMRWIESIRLDRCDYSKVSSHNLLLPMRWIERVNYPTPRAMGRKSQSTFTYEMD